MSLKIKGALVASLLPVLFAPGLAAAGDSTVTLSMMTGAMYDTNVELVPESMHHECFRLDASKCGGDYVLTLSPRIDLMNEQKNYSLDFQYSPTGYAYLGHPNLDYVSQLASAAVTGAISPRTRFFLRDTYTYTMESLLATTTGIQTARGAIVSNVAAVGGDHDATAKSNVAVSASDAEVWYRFPGTVSSRTDNAAVTDSYKMTDNLSVRGTYSFMNIYFDSGSNTNIQNHTVSAGFTYSATPTVVLDVSAGAFYSPDIGQYNWVGSASISKTFQASTWTASYSRGVVPTGLVAEEAINQTYTLAWTYSMTSDFDIGVSGDYAKNKTIPQTVLDVTSYDARLGGTWRINSWATLAAGVTHFDQWSKGGTLAGEAFSRSTIFANLTLIPLERRF